MPRSRVLLLISLSLLLVVAWGCATPGIVSGGGSMPSALTSGKATFTFSGDSCTEATTGQVNFVDKSKDRNEEVKFNGVVTTAGLCNYSDYELSAPSCIDRCQDGWYMIMFDYTSTNPRRPGTGSGWACLKQGFGKGKEKDHRAYVRISSGPYDDYITSGTIQGSVSVQECPPPPIEE